MVTDRLIESMAPRWYGYTDGGQHDQWLTLSTVPFAGTIKNGETVKIECVDWTGGQIGNNDSADDVRDVDLTKIHYLTGPFEIETAEPGDVLVVDIQDVQPLEDHPWGFTGMVVNGKEVF
jgi:formamidase